MIMMHQEVIDILILISVKNVLLLFYIGLFAADNVLFSSVL